MMATGWTFLVLFAALNIVAASAFFFVGYSSAMAAVAKRRREAAQARLVRATRELYSRSSGRPIPGPGIDRTP